jgi:ribosomal protein S18 acetylase RimI-like enzyme
MLSAERPAGHAHGVRRFRVTAISVRPVSPSDLATIDGWAAAIGAAAPSRTRPYAAGADRHDPASGLFWNVVVTDGRDVGTVWIERLGGRSEARLGVFLGDPADFGCGIGRSALRLAIAEFRQAYPGEAVSLHVRECNARAIACYRAVGFMIVDTGSKVLPSGERVAFHTMVLAGRPSAADRPTSTSSSQASQV